MTTFKPEKNWSQNQNSEENLWDHTGADPHREVQNGDFIDRLQTSSEENLGSNLRLWLDDSLMSFQHA